MASVTPLNALLDSKEQGVPDFEFAAFADTCATNDREPSGMNAEVDTDATTTDATAEAPTMSKNQLKKMRRKERTEVKNAYKKVKEKEKKRAVAEERKQASRVMLVGMTEEEKSAELQRRKDGRIERLREKAEKKARQRDALQGGTDLVIDLEFGELMEPHERKSLMQQLMYSYNRNSQAPRPYRLCLTGVTGDMKERVHNICGFDKWQVVSEERSYLERFADRKSDLVYLTADADDTITDLDTSKIYIIGGIVDRNRHKRLTYNKAAAQGIAMAKLPIGDHLRMTSSKVLTVNHVVELLVRYTELKDWQKALDLVVPTRKRAGEEIDRPGTRPRGEEGIGLARGHLEGEASGKCGEGEGRKAEAVGAGEARNGDALLDEETEVLLERDAVLGAGTGLGESSSLGCPAHVCEEMDGKMLARKQT